VSDRGHLRQIPTAEHRSGKKKEEEEEEEEEEDERCEPTEPTSSSWNSTLCRCLWRVVLEWHFAAATQSATRAARIEKAMPAIVAGRGFLERR